MACLLRMSTLHAIRRWTRDHFSGHCACRPCNDTRISGLVLDRQVVSKTEHVVKQVTSQLRSGSWGKFIKMEKSKGEKEGSRGTPSTTQFIISVPPIFYLRARFKVPSAEERDKFKIVSRTNATSGSSSICRYWNVWKLTNVDIYMTQTSK